MKISETELNCRKDRIIHMAFRLFCQTGIDKVSIKDVARAAGVGEKSIYRYFNNKVELVLSTITVLWKEIVSEIISSMGAGFESLSGLEQIGRLMDCMKALFENYAPYIFFSYESKIFLAQKNAKLTEALYLDDLKPIRAHYLAALEKGRADGSIQAQGELEDIYYAVWGLVRGYVAKIAIYDRMYEGENVWRTQFQTACALILGGLERGNSIQWHTCDICPESGLLIKGSV